MNSLKTLLLCVLVGGCGPQPFYGIHFDHNSHAPDVGVGGAAGDEDAGIAGAIATDAGVGAVGSSSAADAGDASDGMGFGGSIGAGGATGTGGMRSSSGGAPGTGGATDDGCVEVTHHNGAGEEWRDCDPLGTYTQAQAKKACEAWCKVNICTGASVCGSAYLCDQYMVIGEVRGPDTDVMRGWAWADGTVRQIATTACTVTGNWN